MNRIYYYWAKDRKPRPVHMNQLQTIMVLIVVCAPSSIGQNGPTKIEPYQVFKPYASSAISCADKLDDFQKCRKQAHEFFELNIDDYFTNTNKFCCFVLSVNQCEQQVAEKCDPEWIERNLYQNRNGLLSSCFTQDYTCKINWWTMLTGDRLIKIILPCLIGFAAIVTCGFGAFSLWRTGEICGYKVYNYEYEKVIQPTAKSMEPSITQRAAAGAVDLGKSVGEGVLVGTIFTLRTLSYGAKGFSWAARKGIDLIKYAEGIKIDQSNQQSTNQAIVPYHSS